MSISLSKRLFAGLAAASVGLTVTACGGGGDTAGDFDGEIKVGILHSLSGTMAIEALSECDASSCCDRGALPIAADCH